uniref:Uracil phosphoribosyltransferase n=1 Tax=Laurencieae sp. TaxID=2007162 RepID=A0A1Z1M388_9FLOR|nr:uracil phosphoribosyltransferase [Laurencieae sp.]
MQLNIYKISHPIIQLLSNVAIIKSNNKVMDSYYYKNLGMLLMYEILRKYVSVQKIYIKSVYSTIQLNLINQREQYFVITDLSTTYEIVSDIKTLLPNIDIINIGYKDILNDSNSINNIQLNNQNTKIFILEKKLNSVATINTVKYLISNNKIPINDINIACIISEQNILRQLSYNYPTIKVYTTQIL